MTIWDRLIWLALILGGFMLGSVMFSRMESFRARPSFFRSSVQKPMPAEMAAAGSPPRRRLPSSST